MLLNKFGTNEVVSAQGEVMVDGLRALHEQSAQLCVGGLRTVWVCSGAGALGGGWLGQQRLVDGLAEATDGRAHEILVGYDDLFTVDGQREYAAEIHETWEAGGLPVVNGHPEGGVNDNDIVGGASAYIMSTYLGGGKPVGAYTTLSPAGGVRGPDGIVPHIHADNVDACVDLVDDSVSRRGTGGMRTKYQVKWWAVSGGYTERGVIASAQEFPDVLLAAAEGRFVGTTFTLGTVGTHGMASG